MPESDDALNLLQDLIAKARAQGADAADAAATKAAETLAELKEPGAQLHKQLEAVSPNQSKS